jgi:hypothetical protein
MLAAGSRLDCGFSGTAPLCPLSGPGAARKQMNDHRDHRKNQQQVNQEPGDVENYKPAGPQDHKQYGQS